MVNLETEIKGHNKHARWVEAAEMDGLRRSSRISRKDKIRNEIIRQ
jgi:hypothetical protein